MLKIRCKQFAEMFIRQLLLYCLCCISYRALAQARYWATFLTDISFATLQYGVMQKIVKEDSKWGQTGYILGGACGSMLAIWISKRMFGV